MDSYNTTQNASIFNFKRIQNDFIEALSTQKFHNEIKNPYFNETRQGSVFAWNSYLGVDVNTPSFIDVNNKEVSYMFTGLGRLSQNISLVNNKKYTIVLNVGLNNLNAEATLSVNSTNQIFIDGANLVESLEIPLVVGTNVLRVQTAISGSMDSIEFRINNTLATENVEILIKNVIMTEGNIALLGAEYSEVEDKIRWNNTNNYWEITIDEGTTYERIWTFGNDFDNHLNALIDQKNVNLIHQGNIFAGTGIIITESTVSDGATGEWPALTISSEVAGGGTGGTGDGDWTKEDVYYQALLNSSDYSHISFNTLAELESEGMIGGASYVETADSFGVGNIGGAQNDGFETGNLIFTAGTYSTFYVDAVVGYDKNITVLYSINSGSGFGSWLNGNYKENTYTDDFTELKVRLLFADTGLTKVYSFGVLYGFENVAALKSSGFLEPIEVNLPYGTNLVIPNDKWYHIDGKSLEIFYDGVRLNINDDYIEVNVGYADKSNTINFNIVLEDDKTLVFKEIYSLGFGGSVNTSPTVVTWKLINTNYQAQSTDKLMVDTSSQTLNITLPATPTFGDSLELIDAEGTHHINNLLVLRNGSNILGLPENLICNLENARWKLTYYNSTEGWKVNY